MNDLIKKGLFIGLGATMASKEKAEKYLRDLSKNGSAAAEESKSVLAALGERGKGKTDEWQDELRAEFKEAIQKLGFVTVEDYNRLNDKVAALEAQLTELKSTSESDRPSEKQ